MAVVCTKEYSVKVIAPISVSAYWKLDEAAGNTNRADSVGTATLIRGGLTDAGTPALINLGVPFTAFFGGMGYTATNASLKHVVGDSYSLWGWFKLDQMGNGDAIGGPGIRIQHAFNRFIFISFGESLDPQPVKITTWNDTVYVATTLSAWHFFHLFFDNTLQQFGYSFDAGFETLLPTALVYGGFATGVVSLEQRWLSFPNGIVIFDEIGFSATKKLTSSQVNTLYNGGAGKTYPF